MLIFAAAVFAVILGAVYGAPLPYVQDVGSLFIDLLKMVVVPIAFVSIAGAVIRLGSGGKACSVTARAFFLMAGMSAVGVALGLAVMSAAGVPDFPVSETTAAEAKAPTVMEFIRGCIPVNPADSFAEGNMLQIITLALFTGAGALCLPEEEKEAAGRALDIAQHLCMKITGFIIRIAPIGVFCLLYPAVSAGFRDMAAAYLTMLGAMIAGSVIYMTFICAPVLKLCGAAPIGFFRTVLRNDLIGAVSGGATNYLAPRIAVMKEKTDIPHEVINYLLPITAALMRAGSCICVGIYTVFAAHIFGVELTADTIAVVVILTIIALTCAPGIIGGTLMDCAIVWAAVGIPLEAIGLIAAIDYLMDVVRTVLNIQGGEVVTACVGERQVDCGTDPYTLHW